MTTTDLITEAREAHAKAKHQVDVRNPMAQVSMILVAGYVSELADALEKADQARAKAEAEVQKWQKAYPCDGGCNHNSGPEETCSRHGRTPAEIWKVAELSIARANKAEAVIETIRAEQKDYTIPHDEALSNIGTILTAYDNEKGNNHEPDA